MDTKTLSRGRTRALAECALMAAVIALCAWISIPAAVPFTLQPFGIFAAVAILGGKRGSAAVAVYLLMGMVGLPVFAGFKGGIGVLLGATGGYILGFLGSALTVWGVERLLGRRGWVLALSMGLGLGVCYAFGTAWFLAVYTRTSGPMSLSAALGLCVLPFVLPDAIKIALALLVGRRVGQALERRAG